MTSDTASNYTAPAIGMHWLLAFLLLATFGVGIYMTDLPMSPQRLKLISWHKWAGVTVLVLSALRLLWRLTHRPPAEVSMPLWQQRAARFTHAAFYLLFFAVPLSGWAYSSAAGFPIVWFGLLPLPDFVAADKAVAEAIKPWHGLLAGTLATLVIVHVAAALKHQFVDRDGLLARMWPARTSRQSQ